MANKTKPKAVGKMPDPVRQMIALWIAADVGGSPNEVTGAGESAGENPERTDDLNTGVAGVQVTAQVGRFCIDPKSARDIMAELGLKHWKTFQTNYLNPLLDAGFLERTIPDKPSSRLQRYRLTQHGKNILGRIRI